LREKNEDGKVESKSEVGKMKKMGSCEGERL
jgi:hypothetical protein